MNKTKIERYMPMILSFKGKAESYGLKDKAKLANDLLKELKGQGENFNEAKLEVLNYALYKVDKTIKVKQYISENKAEFEQAYMDANKGKNVLVVAPTGSGKGYSSDKAIKQNDLSTLTVLPNASIVEQQGRDYEMMSSYGKVKEDATKSLDYCLENSKNMVGATWNKLSDLSRNKALLSENKSKLNDRILVVDEAHEQFSNDFRVDRAEDINKIAQENIFKGTLSMTGTPNRLDFDKYDKIIEYISDDNIKYNVFLYDTVSDDFIINEVNNNVKGRFAIFKDNVTDLEYLQENIKAKTDLICADSKESSQAYKNIMIRSTFGKFKGILHTSTMIAGVNINDKDVTDLFIVNVKDPAKIKQICARYREVEELNIHILNKYPKKQSEFCYIESRMSYIKSKKEAEVRGYNEDIINMGLNAVVEANDFHLKNDDIVYFDTTTSRYRVNEAAIRTKVADDYYERRNREQLEVLLGEYFSNITLVNLNVEKSSDEKKIEFINKMEKEAKATIDSLAPYKDVLVLCNRICKGLRITKDQEIYLKNNNLDIEDLKVTYRTLGVDKLLDNLLFRTHNIVYSDLVTDRHFEKNIAWSLAGLTENEIKKLDRKIKMLNYSYEREINYDIIMTKAKMLIEYQRIEYILSLDLEGKWLNKEHYNLILEDYKKSNARDINVKSTHLKAIIEDIYNVVRSNAKPTDMFYKGLKSDFKGKKMIKAYYCKEKTTLADIASQLNVDANNKTLNDLVNGKKSL